MEPNFFEDSLRTLGIEEDVILVLIPFFLSLSEKEQEEIKEAFEKGEVSVSEMNFLAENLRKKKEIFSGEISKEKQESLLNEEVIFLKNLES